MNYTEAKKKLLKFIKEDEMGPAFAIALGSFVLLGFFFGFSDYANRSKVEKEILEKIRALENVGEDLDYSLLGAEMLYADELRVMDSFAKQSSEAR